MKKTNTDPDIFDYDTTYYHVDNFCKQIQTQIEQKVPGKRNRATTLTIAEIITILLAFHNMPFGNFKGFYKLLKRYHKKEFPTLPSYNRFIELIPRADKYLVAMLHSTFAKSHGLAYVDSTPLPVCHVKREYSHKVFKAMASKSKSSMGWFFGLKLHIVMNHLGQLVNIDLSSGNVDDRAVLDSLTEGLEGLLIGDKGYIDKDKQESFLSRGLQLTTSLRKNMKGALLSLETSILMKKRSVIESVINLLKPSYLRLSLARSMKHAYCRLIALLINYQTRDSHPTILAMN